MNKRYIKIGDLKRNVFILSAAACLGLSACEGNKQQANNEWGTGEETTAPTYSEGVITELTEIAPGEWKITDERPAGPDQVAAIVKHYDGKVDTLRGDALHRGIQEYAAVNPQNVQRSGMWDVLMWSGIGFMAGRMMSPNPGYYANPGMVNRNAGWFQNREQERNGGARFSSYGSGATYKQPTGTYTKTPARTTAPKSGRSGFFGGRSSGFSS